MGSITKTSEIDVLIIGAGPAGLMAATWMSRLGINTRIVDKKADGVNAGQADGIQPRTLEIWESFGIADRILKECNPLIERCHWTSDDSGKLQRGQIFPHDIAGLSRHPQVVLHQGKVEQFLVETIKEHSKIRVERATLPESIELNSDGEDFPVTVTLRHLEPADTTQSQGPGVANGLYRSNLVKDDTDDLIRKSKEHSTGTGIEVVKAKYVIGCDGAHSWTRKHLGFSMEGEQSDFIWGVLDIIPLTNFPDIRRTCTIQSQSSGSILVIPRENKIVRIYCQLSDNITGSPDKELDRSKITPSHILDSARKILSPYRLDYNHCNWWTVYRIGQRVSDHFEKANRIFLAGDAVHTHSPKAGQGQNVSMQDSYNLGWKVAMVLKGELKPCILDTYESERQRVAKDLIDFDHNLSTRFSQNPGGSKGGINEFYEKDGEFMSGIAVDYSKSPLTASKSAKQNLAHGLPLGKRLPSTKVINHMDGRAWELLTLLPSTGHFRVVIFGGDVSQSSLLERVNNLAATLAEGIIPKYTSSSRDCPIEVLLIHRAENDSIDLLEDLHDLYHPLNQKLGYDYERVFYDGVDSTGSEVKAYEKYGVGQMGCVVVVRPDQHVSYIGELEDVEDMAAFFDDILVQQT